MTQTPVVVQTKPMTATVQTSASCTLDTTPVKDNYLVIVGRDSQTVTVNLPAGFVHAESSPYTAGTGRQLIVAYKKCGSSESTTISIDTDGNSTTKNYEVYEVSKLDLAAAMNHSFVTTQSGAATSRAITTTGVLPQANCWVVAMADQANPNGGEVGVDSGFTLRDAATLDNVMVADKITSATTALAPTFTWTTSRQSFGMQTVFIAGPDVPAAPVISTPTAAQVLTTAAFNVTGTAQAGSTVTLYNAADDSVVDTAVATGGNWTISLTGQVTGSYSVYAKATNTGGTGPASATRSYSVSLVTTAPGTVGDTLVYSMNRVAGSLVGGRPTLAATGAANKWAGTTGLGLVGALNVKAGNTVPNYKDLAGVLNQLAGTTGLGVAAAAAAILA